MEEEAAASGAIRRGMREGGGAVGEGGEMSSCSILPNGNRNR